MKKFLKQFKKREAFLNWLNKKKVMLVQRYEKVKKKKLSKKIGDLKVKTEKVHVLSI